MAAKILPTRSVRPYPTSDAESRRAAGPYVDSERSDHPSHRERGHVGFRPLFALAALNGAPLHPAIQGDDFQWRRALAAGKTIEIVGINGSIDASGTGGREVEVLAVKRGAGAIRRPCGSTSWSTPTASPSARCIPTRRRGSPTKRGRAARGRRNTNNNDVQVTWTIRVPEGVEFTGRTVNGEVVARRLTAETEVHTVNGDITVETASWATGSTVNGSIDGEMGRADWRGDADSTRSTAASPSTCPRADLEVDASTVNGSMSTEFPLTIRGKWGPRRMSGTIGQGGRTLEPEHRQREHESPAGDRRDHSAD